MEFADHDYITMGEERALSFLKNLGTGETIR